MQAMSIETRLYDVSRLVKMNRLPRKAILEEVLSFLADRKDFITTLLFVDQTKVCEQYTSQAWVPTETHIVEVDSEIIDHFQIGKIPQFRFYKGGSELPFPLVGTISREAFVEQKNMILGNLKPR